MIHDIERARFEKQIKDVCPACDDCLAEYDRLRERIEVLEAVAEAARQAAQRFVDHYRRIPPGTCACSMCGLRAALAVTEV